VTFNRRFGRPNTNPGAFHLDSKRAILDVGRTPTKAGGGLLQSISEAYGELFGAASKNSGTNKIKKQKEMTEKLIFVVILMLISWINYKEAKDSPPASEDDIFLRFRFNILSYTTGLGAFALLISVIIDFFFNS